jgi:hypothetical protein
MQAVVVAVATDKRVLHPLALPLAPLPETVGLARTQPSRELLNISAVVAVAVDVRLPQLVAQIT